MEMTQLMTILAGIGAGLSVMMLVLTVRDDLRGFRATREISKILAERAEFRPLLDELFARAREHGSLPISEHEQIALREQVRQALVYMRPAERRRVEKGLFSPTVRGREMYLRRVLYSSMQRLHQSA
jgi:hypothetical protein